MTNRASWQRQIFIYRHIIIQNLQLQERNIAETERRDFPE